MLEVKFHDNVSDELLKFAVIISKTNGKWVFCKHKERETYEVPGGRREVGESILETAKRELVEETGLDIENPRLCGIKEFHRAKDGKRYIVFLYVVNQFSGELKASTEGNIFWYPLSDLHLSDKLIDGFGEMLSVFTRDEISEVFYDRIDGDWKTVFC